MQAAANTLEVIVQSGDWKRDEKLELAAIRLAEALNAADTLPELQAAYQATVDAYGLIFMHRGAAMSQINFFREGRRDTLREVRILRNYGQWTQEQRARWIKQAVTDRECLPHTHADRREARAYFAGCMAALKSWTTKDFSPESASEESTCCEEVKGTFTYQPLKQGDHRFCALFDCGEDAVWGIALETDTHPIMVLCDACRQEWQRSETAYTMPDGWDWDEDHQLADLSGSSSVSLVSQKEDFLRLGQMVLPTSIFLSFDVTNIFYPASQSVLLGELLIVVLVAIGSKPMLRLLFWFSNLTEEEMKDF